MASRRALTLWVLAASTLPLALNAAGAELVNVDDCPDRVEPAATTFTDLDATAASYAGLPGFIDLTADPSDPHGLIALFDADFAPNPLPVGGQVGGLTVRVVAETFEPLIAPIDANAPPTIPVNCRGRISPGAQLSTPVGGCSLSFIFTDGTKTYASTAGHCFSALGQRASSDGVGQFGSVVYFLNAGVGSDFALIEIDSEDLSKVNAAMCHWGGPTAPDPSNMNGLVRHYGNGIGMGSNIYTRPRTGYVGAPAGPNHFVFSGMAASGDSGSSARLDTGEGLGVITHVNLPLVIIAHSAPFVYGTRISRGVALAEGAMNVELSLVTAPVA